MEKSEQARKFKRPGIFASIFFTFAGPVIKHARSHDTLSLPDIPHHVNLATSELYDIFKSSWSQRKDSGNKDLLNAILHRRRLPVVLTGIGFLVSQATALAGPLLLGQIVSGLSCRGSPGCASEERLYW